MVEASNLFWKDHKVKFTSKGKVFLETELKEEIKWTNCCLFGWMYGIGLLWSYGPQKYQSFLIGYSNGIPQQTIGSVQLPPGQRIRVAVMDFKAKGLRRTIAKNVSELLRAELINTGSYIVVERSQMGKILQEQGFQKSGCTDVSCAVEIGKLISARKILIGSVMKMGRKIVLSGRIVDVEKGVGEKAATQSATGEDELVEAARLFVGKLEGLQY